MVTGSNGLLGTKLLERLVMGGTDEPLAASQGEHQNIALGDFPFWRLDVTDGPAVERVLDEAKPDAVVHTAAYTEVDRAEENRDLAERVNTGGAANVAQACAARGIRLVHLSTEYVFDGTSGPYTEQDPVDPLGWYAKTKEAGERAVIAAGGNWAIGRTTIIFGYAPHVRNNFVLWLLRELRAGRPVRIIHDQIGSPTLAENLAEMTLALAHSDVTGIFNTAGADVISRLEMSRQIAETFGLDASLMTPVSTAEFGAKAPRPLKAGLVMDHFRETFPDVRVLTTSEGLAVVKRQLEAAGLA